MIAQPLRRSVPMRAVFLCMLLLASSTTHAEISAEKIVLSTQLLSPMIQLLRNGDLGKLFLTSYNKHRESKGKRPLRPEEVEPVIRQSAGATEKAYVDAFANEFSVKELQFITKLFSTKIGTELMAAFSQTAASGSLSKPDLSHVTEQDIAEFKSVAQENPALFDSLSARLENVNAEARTNFSAFVKAHPELKLPD